PSNSGPENGGAGIRAALAALEKRRRQYERQAKGLTRVTVVRQREFLWCLLLDGVPAVEGNDASPRGWFRLRETAGPGVAVKPHRPRAAVAGRLKQSLAQQAPAHAVPEVEPAKPSAGTAPPVLALDGDLLRAVQSSALGPAFAAMLGGTDDRTRYVGLLYRDFKDAAFNRRLAGSFRDVAAVLADRDDARDWKRILVILGP